MPAITFDLSDDEQRQLAELARGRDMTPEQLVQRWVRERLAHERERAAGGGRDMSPRARR
jgi:predicted transcriptional regulator